MGNRKREQLSDEVVDQAAGGTRWTFTSERPSIFKRLFGLRFTRQDGSNSALLDDCVVRTGGSGGNIGAHVVTLPNAPVGNETDTDAQHTVDL